MNLKIIFCFLFLLVALSACSSGGNAFDDSPREFDVFAQCLTEKGVTMYGTEWCSHCKNQKELFGNSFRYVNYVDCDDNMQECIDNGITGYPTWKINEKNYSGEISLNNLALLSGCSLQEDI